MRRDEIFREVRKIFCEARDKSSVEMKEKEENFGKFGKNPGKK